LQTSILMSKLHTRMVTNPLHSLTLITSSPDCPLQL
jgi:hypothetical protein